MPGFHAVVESAHTIQNPSSKEKLLLLGERMELGPGSHVLDVASGQAGPAILLAGAYGCQVTCVERADEFHSAADHRVHDAGLGSLIELVHADAREFPAGVERFDVAMCLGASFVWAGLAGTLAALTAAVRPGGFVAVGEPYWRTWPIPSFVDDDYREPFTSLALTVGRFTTAGLTPITMIDASLDDWDTYETLKWRTGEAWLAEHPDDPGAEEIRAGLDESRDRYVRWQRDLFGWAIFVGRKR